MKTFHVYRSSAGSGKTYTLVKEYLGIVLKNPQDFRNILAITFTNKAANEMRERILMNLTEISDPGQYSDSNAVKIMLPELAREKGMDTEILVRNAGRVLTGILHHYHDFAVGTIDSFIHRIVRAFAFDLHLPLNFEVETEEDVMVSQAVDVLLSMVGSEKEATRTLLGFSQSRIEDEKNWDIERDLKNFSMKILRDDIVNFLPNLHRMKSAEILEVSKKLNTRCRNYEKELRIMTLDVMNFLESSGLSASDFSYKENGFLSYLGKTLKGDFRAPEESSRFTKTITGELALYPKSLIPERKEMVDHHSEGLISRLVRINDYIDSNYEEYQAYSLLRRNIFQLAVLTEVEKIIDQIRENEGVIHISELDKRIAEIVHSEPVPFIYERLGEKYRHYLIDEFQDTSVLEWQNILPLLENALATQNMSMLVGDAKQAIYRFKGGEVEQLDKLPAIFEMPDRPEMHDRELSLRRNFEGMELDKNYRSQDEIINFNNSLYSFLAKMLPERLQNIYAKCVQKIGNTKPGGEVRIIFINEEGTKENKEPAYFTEIHEKVRNLKDNLGYSFRDIAILCRSNREASKIARELLRKNINVVSAESLLLVSSAEVNFLIHCLDYLANMEDRTALAGMLSFISKRYKDGSLHTMLTENPSTQNQENLVAYLEGKGITFNTSDLIQMGLYERIEALIRTFSLDKEVDPYLFFFMDVVHNYLMNKRFIPEDFTEYWRENRQRFSIVVPEGMDAVKVMTIHKAKGLEFPVVIYPFANGKAEIRNEQKWVSLRDEKLPELTTALLPLTKAMEGTRFSQVYSDEHEMQQLDLMNIMYVATTRPTEKLYIICDRPSKATDKVTNIPAMLRSYLEHENLWENEKDEYIIGVEDQAATAISKEQAAVHPTRFISGDWRDSIVLSGHAAEYWDLDDEARKLEWGKLVHKILSVVDTVEDIDKAIQLEVNSGQLAEGKSNELWDLLMRIMSDKSIEPFFNGDYLLHNETTIMRHNGKEYRPDRLMIRGQKAMVLDYKTGNPDPGYKKQMEGYGTLLKEMGYPEVEMYLLYIDEPFILEKI